MGIKVNDSFERWFYDHRQARVRADRVGPDRCGRQAVEQKVVVHGS